MGFSLACSGVPGLEGLGDFTWSSNDLDVSIVLTEEEKAANEVLLATLDGDSFSYTERGKKENARLFLWNTLTDKDPNVIAASLEGMSERYTYYEETDKLLKADEDYDIAVLLHLGSDNDVVLARAIKASTDSIGGTEPNKDIVTELVRNATENDNAAAKMAVIQALASYTDFEELDETVDVYLSVLSAEEPWLVSQALEELSRNTYSLIRVDEFKEQLMGLLHSEDAGTRAGAANMLGRLAVDDEDAGKAVHALLFDENPYVKSEAAEGLSYAKRLASVHKLVEMLNEKGADAENKYELDGFVDLEGEPAKIYRSGSVWNRVDDAVLTAIERLTQELDEADRFDYPSINHENKESEIAAAVAAAKKWYKSHKSSLPPADAEVVEKKAGKAGKAGRSERASKSGKSGGKHRAPNKRKKR